MKDILSMTPWDFNECMEFMTNNPQIWYPNAKRKPTIKKLSERNKDMIRAAKEL